MIGVPVQNSTKEPSGEKAAGIVLRLKAAFFLRPEKMIINCRITKMPKQPSSSSVLHHEVASPMSERGCGESPD